MGIPRKYLSIPHYRAQSDNRRIPDGMIELAVMFHDPNPWPYADENTDCPSLRLSAMDALERIKAEIRPYLSKKMRKQG